jgi:hypothetical protein
MIRLLANPLPSPLSFQQLSLFLSLPVCRAAGRAYRQEMGGEGKGWQGAKS